MKLCRGHVEMKRTRSGHSSQQVLQLIVLRVVGFFLSVWCTDGLSPLSRLVAVAQLQGGYRDFTADRGFRQPSCEATTTAYGLQTTT